MAHPAVFLGDLDEANPHTLFHVILDNLGEDLEGTGVNGGHATDVEDNTNERLHLLLIRGVSEEGPELFHTPEPVPQEADLGIEERVLEAHHNDVLVHLGLLVFLNGSELSLWRFAQDAEGRAGDLPDHQDQGDTNAHQNPSLNADAKGDEEGHEEEEDVNKGADLPEKAEVLELEETKAGKEDNGAHDALREVVEQRQEEKDSEEDYGGGDHADHLRATTHGIVQVGA